MGGTVVLRGHDVLFTALQFLTQDGLQTVGGMYNLYD